MSFRCEVCKTPQEAGIRPTMKVLAYRDRVYTTPGGDIPGREIVQEVKACPTCSGVVQEASAVARALGAVDASA